MFRRPVVLVAAMICILLSANVSPCAYVVRKGDVDGDASVDLFVSREQGPLNEGFFLRQNKSQRFELLARSKAARWQRALSWPITAAGVFGEDLNFDGNLDFIIEGLETVVPGTKDVIIYTDRESGRTPVKSINLDSHFLETWGNVAEVLRHGREQVLKFYSLSCVEQSVPAHLELPEVAYDWLHNTAPDSWYRDAYVDQFGQITFKNEGGYDDEFDLTCFPRGWYLSHELQVLIRSWGDYLGLGGADCVQCGFWAEARLAQDFRVVRLFPRSTPSTTVVEESAFYVTALLIANDPLVGTADSILIPLTALLGGRTESVQMIAHASSDGALKQVRVQSSAPLAKPTRGAYVHPIVDPWSSNPSSIAARAILSANGIGVHEATNGVSIPARSHVAGRVHSKQFEDAVLKRLQLRLLRNEQSERSVTDAQAVREELELLAVDLANGRIIW